jgi:hypothetical protein
MLVRGLAAVRPLAAALRRVRRALREIGAAEGGARGRRFFHGGLNVLLSDGRSLWAYAEARPGAGRSSCLMTPGRPYFRMAFLPLEDRVWAASEPLWSGGRWRGLNSGELLSVSTAGGKARWKKQKIA